MSCSVKSSSFLWILNKVKQKKRKLIIKDYNSCSWIIIILYNQLYTWKAKTFKHCCRIASVGIIGKEREPVVGKPDWYRNYNAGFERNTYCLVRNFVCGFSEIVTVYYSTNTMDRKIWILNIFFIFWFNRTHRISLIPNLFWSRLTSLINQI